MSRCASNSFTLLQARQRRWALLRRGRNQNQPRRPRRGMVVFALFSHTQITRAIVARGIRRSVGETRSPWQRSSCTRAGQSALPFLDFLHTFKTDAAIQVQPKKVARVELPPMPPAEAKKFLIEASFMTTPAFAVICRFDVTFRSCIAARPLAMACAV